MHSNEPDGVVTTRYLCPPPLIALGGPRWREDAAGGAEPLVCVDCDENTFDVSLGGGDVRAEIHDILYSSRRYSSLKTRTLALLGSARICILESRSGGRRPQWHALRCVLPLLAAALMGAETPSPPILSHFHL